MGLFLALCREPALARAGARLGVDASTVSRRLAALERRLDVRLFDRTRDGLRATAAAERLLPAAEAMESAAAAFVRDAETFERTAEGRVRLTAPPGVADFVVAPLLGRLRASHPRLAVELDARVAYADLSRREADLALRATRPTSGDLVARRIFSTRSIPLAAPALSTALGTLRAVGDAPWITYADDLGSLPSMRWLRAQLPSLSPVLLTSAFGAQMRAAEAGVGVVLAPAPFAHLFDLVPLRLSRALGTSLEELPPEEIWLVGHRALRDVPRVAVTWAFLEEAFAELEVAARTPRGGAPRGRTPARARYARGAR